MEEESCKSPDQDGGHGGHCAEDWDRLCVGWLLFRWQVLEVYDYDYEVPLQVMMLLQVAGLCRAVTACERVMCSRSKQYVQGLDSSNASNKAE